jgi:hypothetical protein
MSAGTQGKDTEFELRKKMFEEIKKFNRSQQEELFRILKRNQEEMSENRNGIFFDLMTLKEETIKDISVWMKFCTSGEAYLTEMEKEMDRCRGDLTT